ncbi:GlxA family transcriptional regulator [Actinomadura macrotermitis]|uniref:HTH-type transcriptional activator RhaS n=1 Tax=Actinomadura macrotermitis TaxID=2585200 RepID=A0A7K0BWH5_9ACTN|nr:helix-turn-helix domain-containing protein [Actinomadura macrotermitis]MQY05521.1 HTH-type transcriptional activator RhaS [Actinomadura macrotermitis]
MVHTIAVAIIDEAPIFETAIPCQIFGSPPPGHTGPWYELLLCAERAPGPVALRGSSGLADMPGMFQMVAPHGLDALERADTVIIPACGNAWAGQPPAVVGAVRAAHGRGARIVSLCSGAFVLADAGLLEGRRTAAHWKHAGLLAERHPGVTVDPSVLYIDHGDVLTGAGNTAGIDLCLHLIRHDLGAEVANAVARQMIVPPHRAGGQAQYVETPVRRGGRDDGLGPLLEWALTRLHEPLTVAGLAAEAGLTPRTLIRRFHAETGITPLRWLHAQRVMRARELLERTDLPVDRVAAQCGLGSAANLRAHFAREVGISPSEYRRGHHRDSPVPAE